MKQMTCAQMGNNMPNTCQTMIQGGTPEEMSKNGMDHVKANHPEMAAEIMKMSKEDMDKWMVGFTAQFNALADM